MSRVQSALIDWYKTSRRHLPWRKNPTLYSTVLSEFMLQQTRVDQVIPYYRRFIRELPSLKRLAGAAFSRVIKLWEGLGYYHRAKHLHETAKILAKARRVDLETLRSCPGIGSYTLAAVSSIVWNEPLAVVDGNVKRVIARLFAIKDDIGRPAVQDRIREIAAQLLYRKASGNWNQAVMELGATVCVPRNPACGCCPLQSGCKAFRSGDPENYPVKSKKPPRPHREMAAAVIQNDRNEFLILRRPDRGLLPNLWEFPNFEIGGARDPAHELRRALFAQMNLRIRVGKKIAAAEHAYTHFSVTMHAFHCRSPRDELKLNHSQTYRWVKPAAFQRYPFPKVHKIIAQAV
ncbi:MAG: A/G-specific adenine glycosylase [Candidatus Omnitrophica bacterium]|nr:A/G-specific adenine glycosylase [Candidatus Omnitrophota bacterium]